MQFFGTREYSAPRRRTVSGAGVTVLKSEWMETGKGPGMSPTVFLVEQPAGSVAGAHFHRQNQFQIFVAGGGTIGRHVVEPISVHYANAYTGYGPLVAGPEGMSYFTIRSVFDTGVQPLPEDRKKMLPGPKVQKTLGPLSRVPLGRLSALAQVETSDLMAISENGLGVREVLVPPHAKITVARQPGTDGTFMFVLGGSAIAGQRVLSSWEHLFSSDDSDPDPVAGPDGAHVLMLFMPATDPAYC